MRTYQSGGDKREPVSLNLFPDDRRGSCSHNRRLQLLTQRRSEAQAAVRVVPGQLPTFERAFLVSELRRIVVTAGALLALIVVLAIVLR